MRVLCLYVLCSIDTFLSARPSQSFSARLGSAFSSSAFHIPVFYERRTSITLCYTSRLTVAFGFQKKSEGEVQLEREGNGGKIRFPVCIICR